MAPRAGDGRAGRGCRGRADAGPDMPGAACAGRRLEQAPGWCARSGSAAAGDVAGGTPGGARDDEQAQCVIRRPRRGHVRATARPGGRRRSPATRPELHAGRSPRDKGMRSLADPPTVEEIMAVMRRAGDGVHGRRLRGLIVVLWRAGLRICEALALAEADPDPRRWSLLVRRGKGGRHARWTSGRGSSSNQAGALTGSVSPARCACWLASFRPARVAFIERVERARAARRPPDAP